MMIRVGQQVTWCTHGRGRSKIQEGIVIGFILPGKNASDVYPELAFVPRSRRRFQQVSKVTRVLVEVPKDSPDGKRHYSEYYAPLLAVVSGDERR